MDRTCRTQPARVGSSDPHPATFTGNRHGPRSNATTQTHRSGALLTLDSGILAVPAVLTRPLTPLADLQRREPLFPPVKTRTPPVISRRRFAILNTPRGCNPSGGGVPIGLEPHQRGKGKPGWRELSPRGATSAEILPRTRAARDASLLTLKREFPHQPNDARTPSAPRTDPDERTARAFRISPRR